LLKISSVYIIILCPKINIPKISILIYAFIYFIETKKAQNQ